MYEVMQEINNLQNQASKVQEKPTDNYNSQSAEVCINADRNQISYHEAKDIKSDKEQEYSQSLEGSNKNNIISERSKFEAYPQCSYTYSMFYSQIVSDLCALKDFSGHISLKKQRSYCYQSEKRDSARSLITEHSHSAQHKKQKDKEVTSNHVRSPNKLVIENKQSIYTDPLIEKAIRDLDQYKGQKSYSILDWTGLKVSSIGKFHQQLESRLLKLLSEGIQLKICHEVNVFYDQFCSGAVTNFLKSHLKQAKAYKNLICPMGSCDNSNQKESWRVFVLYTPNRH